MGDSSETFLEFHNHQIEEAALERLLGDRREQQRLDRLLLHMGGPQSLPYYLNAASISLILNHIDYFVSKSRDNKKVEVVYLWPHDINGHDDEVWDKVGQAIGNLQALETLHICHSHYPDDDDEEVHTPDWDALALILSHVRQRITLIIPPPPKTM
jgi:hypothetical protein